MIDITLTDGTVVSVKTCGKFEVEWALAHLKRWPMINRYDLRVAMEKKFDAAPEECRDWIMAAEAHAETSGYSVQVPQAFEKLRAANIARQQEWDQGNEIDINWRGNEMAGEMGEAMEVAMQTIINLTQLMELVVATGRANNSVKKLHRERIGLVGSRVPLSRLAEELADVVICADLVAMTAGIDLDAAVADKFNSTSEKVGLKTRMMKG